MCSSLCRFLSRLYWFRDRLPEIPLSIECLLIDFDDLNLPFDLRFLASGHLYPATFDMYSTHSLLEFIVLLLVKFFLLFQIDLSLISLPYLFLGGLFVLDYR